MKKSLAVTLLLTFSFSSLLFPASETSDSSDSDSSDIKKWEKIVTEELQVDNIVECAEQREPAEQKSQDNNDKDPEPEKETKTETEDLTKTDVEADAETDAETETDIEAGEEENTKKKIPISVASEEILARPDVEKYRERYLSKYWYQQLYSDLEEGMEYRLYVRKAVQDKGLPEILEYLPLIESNYKSSPRSHSGAVGLWQFMSNSVKPFLVLDDFVDQRLDPWYSTEAGLNKLIDNYNYFGDWLIAIAAYNCGGGAMRKALDKAEQKDYWYLIDNDLLPKQTAEYIPKLLAVADLAINSEYYGIDLPDHKEEFELLENEKKGNYDYVTVNKAYSLKTLANEIRLDQETMNRLNPSYIMGITHPLQESKIRLPLGFAQSAEDALKNITPIDYPFKYEVVSGDSLWSISKKYDVTIDEICDLNDINPNSILSIGKILYIP